MSKITGTSRARAARGLMVAAAFLSFTALAAGAKAWLKPAAPVAAGVAAQNPRPARRPGPRRLVSFTLYDAGIYPKELRVDKGLIVLSVEDLTGDSEGVIVERETGSAAERIGHVRRAEGSHRGRGEAEMTPGRYRVYDAGRPENVALLIVEP